MRKDPGSSNFFAFTMGFLFTIMLLLCVLLFVSVFDVYEIGTMLGVK